MSFRYARDHAVADWRVITFPTVQVAVNVVTVCNVKAVKFTVRPASILKSLNVLLHVTTNTHVPAVATQILLNVYPPPLIPLLEVELFVNLIVDVLALSVIPAVDEDQSVELIHVNSHVPEPIVSVLEIVPEELKSFMVTFWLFALKVP